MAMKSLNDFLDMIEDYVAVACFTVMSIVVLVAVFLRYVVQYPFPWGEELARYLMIWGIFMGISIGTRKKAHLGVEAFVNMTPAKVRKGLLFLSQAILLVSYVVIAYLSLDLTLTIKENGQVTPSLRLPMYFIYGALPVGFVLSAIRAAQVLWNDFFAKAKVASHYEEVQTV